LVALLLLPAAWREISGPIEPLTVRERAIAQTEPIDSSAPNVILVVLDTLRADHIELYGYGRETMPRLTAFAHDAQLFESCEANSSWSLPAHATLFTGLYPRQHGAVHHGVSNGAQPHPLAEDNVTLAEMLRSRFYRTAAISANYGYVNREFGLSQGFDHWDSQSGLLGAMAVGFWPSLFRFAPVLDKFQARWILEPLTYLDVAQVPYRRAPEIVASTIAWLDARPRDRPFFLFVNFMEAHDPYRAPGRFADYFPGRRPDLPRDRSPRADFSDVDLEVARTHFFSEYDSELAYLDFYLARLLDTFKERGLLKNSILIVTADHGEQFGEHSRWGHGRAVYQEEVHVPLIISDPLGAPGVVSHPVDQQDVAAWLMERLGLPLPPGVEASDIATGRDAKVAELLGGIVDYQAVLRKGQMALVRTPGRAEELYDLAVDPAEAHDLASERPEQTARLGAELTRWVEARPLATGSAPKLDAQTIEQLRELGYVE
jgi:arylsulfatase A-like enzyme